MRAAHIAIALGFATWLVTGCGGLPKPPRGPACPSAPVAERLHAPLAPGLLPVRQRASAAPLPPGLQARLSARVDELLQKTGAPAISAAIHVEGFGPWSATRGLARVEPAQAAEPSSLFYWASVGKAVTAVTVLQLVDEGRLSLTDPLARWFPDIPNAATITVGQLLSHRSGLATNPQPEPTEHTTRQAWLASAIGTPAILCPDAAASYSNLGFDLLGRIVEAVEGEPFDAVVQRRIAAPLGLQGLRGLREGEELGPHVATPHAGRRPAQKGGAWLRVGSGGIVATAPDMLAFWRATLSGRLLSAPALAGQWSALYAIADSTAPSSNTAGTWFGQGAMLMEWIAPDGAARSWLGHLGGTPHAAAVVAYEPALDAYVAVAANNNTSAAAIANSLLGVVTQWTREQPR